MNTTVGIFAGRGDVIVAMALAFLLGFILAWKIRALIARFHTQRLLKNTSPKPPENRSP